MRDPSSASNLSNYAPLRELARGGMGAVLETRDAKLGRMVAMKVLLRRNASKEEKWRFHQEARVLGQLAHPNIVPIHDSGTDTTGQPFYTMKLVQGITLKEILTRLKAGDATTTARYPLSVLLTIFHKVCDAVAFAHSRGIIHRDLKPQNIMVGEFGEVLVMDWGLAKFLPGSPSTQTDEPPDAKTGPSEQTNASRPNADDESTLPGEYRAPADDAPIEPLCFDSSDAAPPHPSPEGIQATLEGAVMGTPHYMSPEQAQGRTGDLDERSDIFSLGGILYGLLTLHPPVDGATLADVLEKVRSANIAPPTTHTPTASSAPAGNALPLAHCPGGRVPPALSSVAMKALARDPADRYQRVAELAADIEAYQNGFATTAEDAGILTLLRLFIRRHKTLTSAAMLMVVLSVAFMIQLVASERRATKNALLAKANAETAQKNEREAIENEKRAEKEATRATAAERVALAERETTRQALARAKIALAEAAYRAHDGVAMRAALREVPEDLRDEDHAYLALRADSSLAALRTRVDGRIRGSAAHPTRPGVFAVAGADHRIQFLNARTGRHLSSFPTGFRNVPVQYVLSFSPDGSLLAVGNRDATEIRIFAADSGKPLARWKTRPPESIEFGPKGRQLLVVPTTAPTMDRLNDRGRSRIRALEALSGKEVWSREFDSLRLRGVYVGQGDRVLVSYGVGARPALLDARDGREIRTLPGLPDYMLALAASPDGLFMLVGNEQGRLRKVRLEDGEVTLDLRVSESRIRSIVITPDGKRFATLAAQQDQSVVEVKIWDMKTGSPLATLLGVEAPAYEMCLHPESLELLVAGSVASKSWDLFQLAPTWTFESSASKPTVEFWGADDWLLFATEGPRLAVRQLLANGLGSNVPTRLSARRLDVSQDGRRAIAGPSRGPLTLLERDGSSVQELATFSPEPAARLARLNPDGTRLWTGPDILDATTGKKLASIQARDASIGAWVGTNHLVIAGRQDDLNWVTLIDASNGEESGRRQTGHARILCLAGAPDGLVFAEAGHDRRVRVRRRDSLKVASEFRAHDAPIFAVAFHPTRPILASGSADLSVRLWDFETGTMLEELRGPLAVPRSLSFSPGGTRLACVSLDHQLRVWEPRCLQPESNDPPGEDPTASGEGEWIDLIAGLDPDKIKVEGHGWELQDGELQSPDRMNAVVALPGELVNESYQLQIAIRRLEPKDFLGIVLPVGTRQTCFVLDGYPTSGHFSGLHLLGGTTARYDPNAVEGRQIRNNAPHQIEVIVRHGGLTSQIEVHLDSQPFYRWNGPTSSLSMSPRIRGIAPGRIGFASHLPEWVISSANVRRL